MPELPEVETIRFDLHQNLKNYVITDLWTNTPKMLQPSYDKVRTAVISQKIKAFSRRAKIIIIDVNDSNVFLVIHLKMTGRLLIRKSQDLEDKWTHVIFYLHQGKKKKELRFADQRKFGYVKLVNKAQLEEILSKLGPEPLDDLTYEIFRKTLLTKKVAIKKVLLDQSLFSGIGNIYANDALYMAQIHPETKAQSISDKKMKLLFEAIEEVLRNGLKYRGASDNSYLDAFGLKGQYQEHFMIYGKDKSNCLKCGSKIQRIKVGGRGTFICPLCQKR